MFALMGLKLVPPLGAVSVDFSWIYPQRNVFLVPLVNFVRQLHRNRRVQRAPLAPSLRQLVRQFAPHALPVKLLTLQAPAASHQPVPLALFLHNLPVGSAMSSFRLWFQLDCIFCTWASNGWLRSTACLKFLATRVKIQRLHYLLACLPM
jgi:hypothetical protein